MSLAGNASPGRQSGVIHDAAPARIREDARPGIKKTSWDMPGIRTTSARNAQSLVVCNLRAAEQLRL